MMETLTLLLFLEFFLLWKIYSFFASPLLFIVIFIIYIFTRVPESKFFRNVYFWKWFRTSYFNISEYGTSVCKKQCVYAIGPHGVYGSGAAFQFVLNEKYENAVALASSLLFYIPIVKEFVCLAGARPAHKKVMIDILEDGKDIIILPEGLRSLFHYNEDYGMLKILRGEAGNGPRTGFIRAILESGKDVCIVPVFIKGQNKTFDVWMPWPWFQKKMLSLFYFPWPVLTWGHWRRGLFFFPRPVKLDIYYGNRIHVEGKGVRQIHQEYCKSIQNLISASLKNV